MRIWVFVVILLPLLACKQGETAAPKPEAKTPPSAPPQDKPAAKPDPKPTRGPGPGAGIAAFRISETYEGDEAFELILRIHLDHTLGFVEAPLLEIGARSADKTIARSYVTERDELILEHTIEIPSPGLWSVDLYADGEYLRSNNIALAKTLCSGGEWSWTTLTPDQSQKGAPSITLSAYYLGDERDFGFDLRVESEARADEPAVAIFEWLHKGKLVHNEMVDGTHLEAAYQSLDSLDQDGSAACVESTTSFPQQRPGKLARGPWKVRVHQSGKPSIEASFQISGKEQADADSQEEAYISIPLPQRVIATPPEVQKKLGARVASIKAGKLWRERAPELRAVIRSEEALYARIELNEALQRNAKDQIAKSRGALSALVQKHGHAFNDSDLMKTASKAPKTLESKKAPAPPTGGCDESRCESYPALSPDNKFIVYRYAECDETGYDQDLLISRHYQIGEGEEDSEEVESRDLSGYQPLDCSNTGFKIVTDDYGVSVVKKAGTTLKVSEDAPVARVCAYPKEKTVLVIHHHQFLEGLTGEPLCVEGASAAVVTY